MQTDSRIYGLFGNPGLQELSTFNLSFRRPGSEAYVPTDIRLPEQLPATDQSHPGFLG